jgi:hypothetical protein
LDSNGRVGIGTSSPGDKLHVSGTTNLAGNSYLTNTYVSGNIYIGGTGSANAISDYEEGTFTPNISYSTLQNNPTHSRQDGQYTKIGNVVHIQMRLVLTNKGSGSGNVKVNGLPFGVDDSPNQNQGITAKPIIGVDLGGDRELFCQFEGNNTTSLFLYSFGIESSANYSVVTSSHIGNDLNVQFFGSYFTNS